MRLEVIFFNMNCFAPHICLIDLQEFFSCVYVMACERERRVPRQHIGDGDVLSDTCLFIASQLICRICGRQKGRVTRD